MHSFSRVNWVRRFTMSADNVMRGNRAKPSKYGRVNDRVGVLALTKNSVFYNQFAGYFAHLEIMKLHWRCDGGGKVECGSNAQHRTDWRTRGGNILLVSFNAPDKRRVVESIVVV